MPKLRLVLTRFDTNDENTKSPSQMSVNFSIILFASCNNFEIYLISKYKVKLVRRYYFFIEVPLLQWLALKLLSCEVVGLKFETYAPHFQHFLNYRIKQTLISIKLPNRHPRWRFTLNIFFSKNLSDVDDRQGIIFPFDAKWELFS